MMLIRRFIELRSRLKNVLEGVRNLEKKNSLVCIKIFGNIHNELCNARITYQHEI